MKHKIHPIKYALFLLLFFALETKADHFSEKRLADSIRAIVNSQTLPDSLELTFGLIREKRNILGDDYIPLLKQYAERAKSTGYVKGEMKAYDFIGLQYRYNENYNTAYQYHNMSLELAIREKDSAQLFYNYNNLGQVFRKQDITDLAIEYFHKALAISDAVGNLRSSSYSMNALGTTLILQKDYDRAMSYFQQSSDIARQRNDTRTLAYNYGSIGEIFLIKEQNDSAMYYFQVSRDLLLKTGSDEGMGVAEHLIGRAYLANGEYNKAKEKFEQALFFHQKNKDLRYQSYCNCYLSEIAIAQKNYTNALHYLDLATSQAQTVSSLKNLMTAYTNYAEIYKKQNQWEKAYAAMHKSHIYQDSIINEANNKAIQALEIRFETQKKEQQIELLTTENELKNQRLRAGIILLAVLLVVIVMILYILQIRRKQARLAQNDLQQKVLRSQMNPHFIFNVLGSIQNYIMGNDTKKAANYLAQFASLTRSTLEYSASESIALSDEIKMLANYMELEKMRKPGKFNFEIITSEELEADFIRIPPMMIQPFIENAIKHGFNNIDYRGQLTVKITDKEQWVEFIIEDNGKGIKANPATGHRSMAMEIFEKRRKLIQQKHKKEFKFELTNLYDSNSSVTGVRIVINIPIFDV
ncbi:Tetratricopeptide repeat-containing protein [Mariniphaga anaerophila]|uniref:Tetratricopeptide repeat-containing protein n=1 Tax=Mariniphaga anaerophila TaxID=1484053 RepID=A0A1M5DEL4_9BACT|nr:tetratricopeptide repeat protein [Mariniphaga anaerophila]SHF65417.1 Tetratricopeptide repeat-containing protein [Mariniphaga anaerophila]